MPETTVERIVAGTAHSWLLPHPTKAGEHIYQTARHGERIQVSEEEAARGEALGTLVDEAKARANAMTRADLLAKIEELQAELSGQQANVPPAMIAPPPAPGASTTLTPSMTGIPQTAPLPNDVGPIGPTTAAAVAAARAATGGAPVVSVTPLGHPITNPAALHPTEVAGAPAAPLPGGTATDDQLAAMNANDLVAYLNQHSDDVDEVERVDELEAGRARGPRKTVTDAVEAIRAAAASQE